MARPPEYRRPTTTSEPLTGWSDRLTRPSQKDIFTLKDTGHFYLAETQLGSVTKTIYRPDGLAEPPRPLAKMRHFVMS